MTTFIARFASTASGFRSARAVYTVPEWGGQERLVLNKRKAPGHRHAGPRRLRLADRLLGQPPEPPADIPAIEPDVRGAKTVCEQLDKHRNQAVCTSCHAKIDPPGFALEAFDVIGGWRERYRSIGEGDAAPRGEGQGPASAPATDDRSSPPREV
ncbi:MAG TPA: DUF1588 domain-containing protein [Pirellulales bacterium]|nr:DUF1588 domain-containing protein [Pirellulales bacterium]